jgi:molybdopterin converting factor small subunit
MMSVKILVPTALRTFTDGKSEILAEGSTVGEAIADLAAQFPDIQRHLYDENGVLRSFVNVYVGETNIKGTGGLDTKIPEGGTITLVPAIAGGTQ